MKRLAQFPRVMNTHFVTVSTVMNPFVKNICLRCHSKLMKQHHVVSMSELQKEEIELMIKREKPCDIDGNEDVEWYCEECKSLVYRSCLKDQYHNHKTSTIQDFIASKTDSVSNNLQQIAKMSSDEKEMKQQEEIAVFFKQNIMKIKKQVKELTSTLVKTLRDNEQQLLNEIDNKAKKVDANVRIIHHSDQAQEYIKNFIENATASEMLDYFEDVTYNHFDKTMTGIQFTLNEELCAQIKQGIGQVEFLHKKADPKMSSIKVESDLKMRKKSSLILNLKTEDGDSVNDKESIDNLTVKFTPEDHVQEVEIHMADACQVSINFLPRFAGHLKADVKLYGNPVCNSRLAMLVKPQQLKSSCNHSILQSLNDNLPGRLSGIAVNTTSRKIAVASSSKYKVSVFSIEGQLLRTISGEDLKEDCFSPKGLAFLNENELVIAESGCHRICIVNTTTGQLVRTFGCGEFNSPRGVHVDDDGNIIVCDYDNGRVQVFTKDGNFLYQFKAGKPHCAIKHNGLFYVSTSSEVRVIEMNKYKQSPRIITKIGEDCNYGLINDPRGLAIDTENNILVCVEEGIHRLTLDGRYIGHAALDDPPSYIAVMNDGHVICTTSDGVFFFTYNN